MALSHDKNVAEVFVIGLFLGINFVTLLKALRWLLCDDKGWKRRQGVDWIMVVITVVIFGSTIARAVFGVRNTMVAVMEPPDSVAASSHYGPVATPSDFSWVTMADVSGAKFYFYFSQKIVLIIRLFSFFQCVAANLPILLSDAVFVRPLMSGLFFLMLYNQAKITAVPPLASLLQILPSCDIPCSSLGRCTHLHHTPSILAKHQSGRDR
jgi:hypothetical protein